MEWNQLLSAERLSAILKGGEENTSGVKRSEFNRDYGRVLYSSAFRRLQDKTQVFPLGRNDYVRTRMTHSLEVANVGRSLANNLHEIITEREGASRAPSPEELEDIVATVCLAHDIGNPPFGHSGEDAINTALKGTPYESYVFEGNAQGFRLLSRTCDPIHGHGLDLTAATLTAFAKYPCTRNSRRTHYKKFGLMAEEADIFHCIATFCGLRKLDEHGDVWARHPLALLMEAADDISYLIADVEDAFFSKIISYEECMQHLALMAESIDLPKHLSKTGFHDRANSVHLARALAVGESIRRVTDVLRTHYDAIMKGSFCGSLMKHTENRSQYDRVKDFSVSKIYNHESVLRIEIAGFNVLKQLLNLFMEWVIAPQSHLGKKVGDILHAPHLEEEHERFLHIIDYVSGMTDTYALHTYNTLFGLSAL